MVNFYLIIASKVINLCRLPKRRVTETIMITIEAYRQRIGLFRQPSGTRQVKLSNDRYTPHVSGSDIYLRLFVCTFLFTIHALCTCGLLHLMQINFDLSQYLPNEFVCVQIAFQSDVTIMKCTTHFSRATSASVTDSVDNPVGVTYLLLLCSGDVELNPGPVDLETMEANIL